VKKGDRVLFGKWSGTEVKIDGEELLIMKETDILGVMREKRRCAQRPDRRPLRLHPRVYRECEVFDDRRGYGTRERNHKPQ